MNTKERVNVQLDLFPAIATVMSTTYKNIRAVIANGTLYLYTLTGSGPAILYQQSVDSVDGQISSGVTVGTPDGEIEIEQDGGCGCGSQLKVMDLFPDQQRVMVPLHS